MRQIEDHEIGARIAQARKEAGLTQENLAELIGVGQRMVQYYEAGNNTPWRLIPRIAEVTSRTTAWLLYGVDEPTDSPEFRDLLLGAIAGLRDDVAALRNEVAAERAELQALSAARRRPA